MAYEYEAEIRNEQEWTAYTLKVDSHYGIYFNHEKPERYPVRVFSEKTSDDDGRRWERDCMRHDFTYKHAVKCDHCGHETMAWPDGVKLA